MSDFSIPTPKSPASRDALNAATIATEDNGNGGRISTFRRRRDGSAIVRFDADPPLIPAGWTPLADYPAAKAAALAEAPPDARTPEEKDLDALLAKAERDTTAADVTKIARWLAARARGNPA